MYAMLQVIPSRTVINKKTGLKKSGAAVLLIVNAFKGCQRTKIMVLKTIYPRIFLLP
jgi:hypothetical protein